MSGVGVRDDRERIAFNPAHLDDYGLDPYEFRVYMRFSRRAGTKSTAYESVAKIAEACGMSERKVRYVLKCLVAYKLVGLVERGVDAPNEYAMLPYAKWIDPGHIPAVRERVLKADPEKKPQHKSAAPDARAAQGTGGAAQFAGGAAQFADGGLHSLQTKVAPSEGSPLKVAPLKGSVSTDALARENTTHPKHTAPPEYADLYGIWNQHRGALPETINNDGVNKLLKTAVSKYDRADLLVLIEQGAKEVATDSYWLEKKYGLVNLLRNLDSKAEAFRARGDVPQGGEKVYARRNQFRNFMGAQDV